MPCSHGVPAPNYEAYFLLPGQEYVNISVDIVEYFQSFLFGTVIKIEKKNIYSMYCQNSYYGENVM
jgi:hypothetical protein